jgi:hypothetical protein
MSDPKIVAECWTCGGVQMDTRELKPFRFTTEQAAEFHRNKGHDVRPVPDRCETHGVENCDSVFCGGGR